MNEKNIIAKKWIITGFISGFIALLIYPFLLIVSLPLQITVIMACGFGVFLTIASMGLYYFIKMNASTVTLKIGLVFNVIGSTIVTMMFLVQLSIYEVLKNKTPTLSEQMKETGNLIWKGVNSIQLGLDVTWDVYIALGTLLIAFNMWRHPCFGKIFSTSGIIIALVLLFLNISTFPTPPAQASLIDLGPLLGLWYLIVTIQTARSMKWVDEKLKST